MYWACYGMLSLIDSFAENIMAFFPLYWLLKMIFFICLISNVTFGEKVIFEYILEPLVDKIDSILGIGTDKTKN